MEIQVCLIEPKYEQQVSTVWWEKIIKKTTNFALQLKGKKFRKRTKMHLPIIWIERIPLLQLYFSHFIIKQGIIFWYICFKQGTQFCSACSSSGLIYYGPSNWSFTRQIPCTNHFIIIIYHEFILYFFQKIVFFCILASENQEAFSERCSLISGVLQSLVKICKKYMEVNHFLLLSCSLEK